MFKTNTTTVSTPATNGTTDNRLVSQLSERELIEVALGRIFPDTVWDDSAADTARRVAKYWRELYPKSELDFEFTTFEAVANQMIIVRDIEFASACAHHLLPFYGKAHVAYLPNKLQVGLSKIPRLVNFWAQRPQVQEALTNQIAHDLKDRLQAQGVAVVIEGVHTCQTCRGVRNHNGKMVTSDMRGTFLTADSARMEFLSLITHSTL